MSCNSSWGDSSGALAAAARAVPPLAPGAVAFAAAAAPAGLLLAPGAVAFAAAARAGLPLALGAVALAAATAGSFGSGAVALSPGAGPFVAAMALQRATTKCATRAVKTMAPTTVHKAMAPENKKHNSAMEPI